MTKPDFAVDPKDYAKLFEAIQRQNEPLHPDLAPYYEEDSFAMLRHPLIYQVPFFSGGQANYQYEVKKKLVEEALEKKNYKSFVWLHERPYRLEAFAQIEQLLDDKEYWSLLGQIWTDTENGWAHLAQWKKFFGSTRADKNYLMDSEELMVLDNLPQTIAVYRGCQKGLNENGISWTLDKDRAEWFATRFGKEGKVLEMRINKSKIVAVFTGRNESEVVIV